MMYENLSRVKSQDLIQNGSLEGLDHQGIYDIYLVAFGDEDVANGARTKFLESLVKRQCDSAFSNGVG
jgi:hypothetical protein